MGKVMLPSHNAGSDGPCAESLESERQEGRRRSVKVSKGQQRNRNSPLTDTAHIPTQFTRHNGPDTSNDPPLATRHPAGKPRTRRAQNPLLHTTSPRRRWLTRRPLRPARWHPVWRQARREVPRRGLGEDFLLGFLWQLGFWRFGLRLQA